MATILLVEDGATVSREVTRLLEAAGHRVVRCGGGPTPLAACLLMRHGRCPFVDNADLVVFACALALPLPGRSYRGMHLLRAYRAHPDYGRLPLVLVAVAPPHNLGGAGPIEVVETHTVPAAVVAAVDRLLQPTGQTPDRPLLTGRAGVDDEAPPGLLAVSSADLRGVFRPATAVAGDRLALPHDAGRTVSSAPAARSCGEPLRYNEEGLGRGIVASETACRTSQPVHVEQLRRRQPRPAHPRLGRFHHRAQGPRAHPQTRPRPGGRRRGCQLAARPTLPRQTRDPHLRGGRPAERSLELDVPQVQSGSADEQLAGRLRRDGSEQFALAETAAPRHASGSTVPPSANAWQVQQLCNGWLERHPELPAAAREVTRELGWRGRVHAELAELDRPAGSGKLGAGCGRRRVPIPKSPISPMSRSALVGAALRWACPAGVPRGPAAASSDR